MCFDVFGPWSITTRCTRGRWAIMFCCLSSRAVHIEVIDSLDTSSCINPLRRFFAIRGPAKQLWLISDCGTNFIGASKELGTHKKQSNKGTSINKGGHGNSPSLGTSNWSGQKNSRLNALWAILWLDPYVLCTLMAEVTAIKNARPLTLVSTDPENPLFCHQQSF